jgi:glycosyltransferase involved in cell wall biosynthesis
MELRIAAKVDSVDRAYFEREVRPLLDGPGVRFVGEIGEDRKGEFLGNARALVFPIDWPEPFGLVMIEALACGTPVVAWGHGSVPEILRDGVTGFIAHDADEFARALERVGEIDRRECRRVFESSYSAARMARDYVEVYLRTADEPLSWKR